MLLQVRPDQTLACLVTHVPCQSIQLCLQTQQLKPVGVLCPVPHLGRDLWQLRHSLFSSPQVLILSITDRLVVLGLFTCHLSNLECDIVIFVVVECDGIERVVQVGWESRGERVGECGKRRWEWDRG